MKYRTRTFYTDKQKSEMWDRWQRGESMSLTGRHFNRASSSIFSPGLLVVFLIVHSSVVTMSQKHSFIKLPYLDP